MKDVFLKNRYYVPRIFCPLLSSKLDNKIESKFTEVNMKNILVAAIVILALFSGSVSALDNIERKKIEFLISSVEHQKGVKFIRNGSEHDVKAAAEHLRMKLQKAGSKVQTADDFIRLCASKSYISGKPYTIKFADGKTIKSEEYFREKLKGYNPTIKKEHD
jgi:hypothetical protein